MILVIDNYDSFVANVARYFRMLGEETQLVRNDAIGVDEIVKLRPDAIVVSPGPCTPAEAGVSNRHHAGRRAMRSRARVRVTDQQVLRIDKHEARSVRRSQRSS